MTIRLDGQVALITGAGGGLGRAYALDLAARGAKVVVNDLGGDPNGRGADAAPAQKVCDEIAAAGGEAIPSFDSVATSDGGYAMVKAAMDAWGRLDIVICNAGILRDSAFHNMNEEDWDTVFNVHIKGSYTVLHAAWPVFRQQAYGRVVLTTSGSGIFGNFGQANYGAAKAAMFGLMNVLKLEGARYNVMVNCIAPLAATRLTAPLMDDERRAATRPEFVVPAVTYLVSPACTDTGMVIEAEGGAYNRAVLLRTRGVDGGQDEVRSAEWIAEHWAQITEIEGLSQMWRLGQSMTEHEAEVAAGADTRQNRL